MAAQTPLSVRELLAAGRKTVTLQRVVFFYLLSSIVASVLNVIMGSFCDYHIYSLSFYHLMRGEDLYAAYPSQNMEHFRYSPTFALLYAPLAVLPPYPSVILLNLLNVCLLILGVWRLFAGDREKTQWVLLILFLEAFLNIQHIQTNLLTAGCILLGYCFLEKERPLPAALCFTSCGFIKIYGMAAAVLCLFFPRKIRFILWMIACCAFFALLPLTVVPGSVLWEAYQGWYRLTRTSINPTMLNLMGVLEPWLPIRLPYAVMQCTGLAVCLLPLVLWKQYASRQFRLLFTASLLIFMVIFNHMSESATVVLAVMGVAIWFVIKEKPSKTDLALLGLILAVTSLSHTDILPNAFKESLIFPYRIKVIPPILVWIKIQLELWGQRAAGSELPKASAPGTMKTA